MNDTMKGGVGKGTFEAAHEQLGIQAERNNNRVAQDEAAFKEVSDTLATAAKGNEDANAREAARINSAQGRVGEATTKYQESLDASAADVKKTEQTYEKSTGENKKKVENEVNYLEKLTKETDPNKVAEKLVKEQEKITEQKMKLADDMSQWYEGIATSYQDIASRYRDAVTGLTSAEKSSMKAEATQDFAALSAMGGQGASVIARGNPAMSGAQLSALAGASQRAATDSYASAMSRMATIDQQRRDMQLAMVQSASADEARNRQLGAGIMGTQIGMKTDALQTGFNNAANLTYQANEDKFAHGVTKYQNTLAGVDAMQGYDTSIRDSSMQAIGLKNDLATQGYGASMDRASFDVGAAQMYGDLSRDTIDTNTQAATYAPEAGIAYRAGLVSEALAGRQLDDAKAAREDARRRGQNGVIMGVVGAGVGLVASGGNPLGAAAGYTIGSGVGSSM